MTAANFVTAVDEAFLSRADLVLRLGLPDAAARAQIVAAALADLAGLWPALKALAGAHDLHAGLAAATKGWDGRRLRKLPLHVIAGHPGLARAPARLTAAGLYAAAGR